MFDRYTDRSRRAIVLAQEHARAMGHPEIDVDHLLLGLAAEGGGVAFQALEKTGVTAEGIRQAITGMRTSQGPALGHLPFTRQAKRALELGLRESVRLGHPYIGTEHLLLGVVADCEEGPGSPCTGVLEACGTTPGEVRAVVMVLLRSYGAAPSAAPVPDEDPRMAAVAALLEDFGRLLEQLREILGIPA